LHPLVCSKKDPPSDDDGGEGSGRGLGRGKSDKGQREGDAKGQAGKHRRTVGSAQGYGGAENIPPTTVAWCGVPPTEVQFRDHLPLSGLHLGRELGRGITGVVKEGLLGGQRVAVKMSDLTAGHLDVPLLSAGGGSV
jgi:hypothetical protein